MLCSGSRKWGVLGLMAAFGCALPDLGGSSGTSSSSSGGEGDGPGESSGVATSTEPGPGDTSSGVDPTTGVGAGSASGTTTAWSSSGSDSSGQPGTTTGGGDTSTGGSSTGPDAPLCEPAQPLDACTECVAARCEADFCECAGLGDCLCVLGCLDSDSLAALLGCVLGDCGLVDVSLDTLGNLLASTLSPLDGCDALDSEVPESCAGLCPATTLFPL